MGYTKIVYCENDIKEALVIKYYYLSYRARSMAALSSSSSSHHRQSPQRRPNSGGGSRRNKSPSSSLAVSSSHRHRQYRSEMNLDKKTESSRAQVSKKYETWWVSVCSRCGSTKSIHSLLEKDHYIFKNTLDFSDIPQMYKINFSTPNFNFSAVENSYF